jgi:hypothetical protein
MGTGGEEDHYEYRRRESLMVSADFRTIRLMHEGINWAVWTGIILSGFIGASSLLYNIYRDRVKVTIVTKIDAEPIYKEDEQGRQVYIGHDLPVFRAIVTNTGFLGVKIQAVEVQAVGSKQRYPLKKEGLGPSQKLIDGDHEVWGEGLGEVRAAFDDVPSHASAFAIVVDTAGRRYKSRNWTTIRTYQTDPDD